METSTRYYFKLQPRTNYFSGSFLNAKEREDLLGDLVCTYKNKENAKSTNNT